MQMSQSRDKAFCDITGCDGTMIQDGRFDDLFAAQWSTNIYESDGFDYF